MSLLEKAKGRISVAQRNITSATGWLFPHPVGQHTSIYEMEGPVTVDAAVLRQMFEQCYLAGVYERGALNPRLPIESLYLLDNEGNGTCTIVVPNCTFGEAKAYAKANPAPQGHSYLYADNEGPGRVLQEDGEWVWDE